MLLARGGRGGRRGAGRRNRELAFEHLAKKRTLATGLLAGEKNKVRIHRHRDLGLGITLEDLLDVVAELHQFGDLALGGNGGIDKQAAYRQSRGNVVVALALLLVQDVDSVHE